MCTLYTNTNTHTPKFTPSRFFGPSKCLVPAQSEGLLIPRSSVRFRLKPENSNSHGLELHRPSIKGTKLLLKVIKATIIIMCALHTHIHLARTHPPASKIERHKTTLLSLLLLKITRHPCDNPNTVFVRQPSAAESCKKIGR